ncbi:hypothetical protein [Streptomyces sp. bgisy034]|uniref:hypothetical protein n=1 Tax=Streptomyces sp. bgisy034 TaxID=3413774 RepID=UPI003EB8C12F
MKVKSAVTRFVALRSAVAIGGASSAVPPMMTGADAATTVGAGRAVNSGLRNSAPFRTT